MEQATQTIGSAYNSTLIIALTLLYTVFSQNEKGGGSNIIPFVKVTEEYIIIVVLNSGTSMTISYLQLLPIFDKCNASQRVQSFISQWVGSKDRQ